MIPTRAHLDGVRRLMRGDFYIGRGCKQRNLQRSPFANPYKVSVHGREAAVDLFAEHSDSVWRLSGRRLLCHCKDTQKFHGDKLISEFRRQFPGAYDRSRFSSVPPSARVLGFLARLREEPESDDTSADEGAPPKGAGWRGKGPPMEIGTGYSSRKICDGQSLASPGRWRPRARVYPETEAWSEVAGVFRDYADRLGTPDLSVKLACGRVAADPFEPRLVRQLKEEVSSALRKHSTVSLPGPVTECPVDFRFLQLLLQAAEDPEVGLGDFSQGPGSASPGCQRFAQKKRHADRGRGPLATELFRNRAARGQGHRSARGPMCAWSSPQVLRARSSGDVPGSRCRRPEGKQERQTRRGVHSACAFRWHERNPRQ